MTEPLLLNCTRLSELLDKSPSFVTAMKRAGYRFRYEAAARTTLAHALDWLEATPQFLKRFNEPQCEIPQRSVPVPAKKRPRAIPTAVRRQVIERDGHACHYCGETTDLSFDHKLAFVSGGDHSVENVVVACFSCNVRKRTMPYEKFKAIAHKRQPIFGGRPGSGIRPRIELSQEEQEALDVVLGGPINW